ncbi:MAG: hypothetical protein QOK31_24 [Solirubrobacteraceae bacterium]|jgi:hypothetical protein|nr:hypothetical protein [Solirubrobacteraceae bacterium]
MARRTCSFFVLALTLAGALVAASSASAAPGPFFAQGPDGAASEPVHSNAVFTAQIRALCPGDFNGDGHQDVAVAESSSDGVSQVLVALGNGTGDLGAWTGAYTAPTTDVATCAAADFNHDGKTDLVAGYSVGGPAVNPTTVTFLRSTGTGFAATPVTVPGRVAALATGDFNRDGKPDAVAAIQEIPGKVQLITGDGAGHFTAVPDPPASGGDQPAALSVADFNGDGYDDVVVTNRGTTKGMATLFGSPTNLGQIQANGATAYAGVAAGDLNGDGSPDLALTLNALRVGTNDGHGAFTVGSDLYPNPKGDVTSLLGVALADFNGDGALDAVAGDSEFSPSSRVWSFAGDGLGAAHVFDETANGPFSISTQPADVTRLAVVDLDEDGHPDLVAGTETSVGLVGVLLNTTPIAPVNSAPPQIAGTAQVGKTLTCQPGAWTGKPTFTYQWLRAGVALVGETSTTHKVSSGDVGLTLTCRVTATNTGGPTSATTPGVIPTRASQRPRNTRRPSITGRARAGETLACNAGDWTAGGRFGYSWLRNNRTIHGARRAGYRLGRSDRGRRIACRVTVVNADGRGTATSRAVKVRRR